MNSSPECWLHSINNVHDPILLENGKEVVLGRGPLTKVTDKRCSRNQVSVVANTKISEIIVKQIGDNASGCNGLALAKGKSLSLKHGDNLELLFGEHIYRVEFKPLPGSTKRPLLSPDLPCAKKSETMKKKEENSKLGNSWSPQTISTNYSQGAWESVENGKLLIFTPEGLKGRTKIAAYDLDHTVITTKNGTVFPKDTDDWKIAFNEVPGKLKKLWSDGFKIVFFTNQAGIEQGKVRPQDFKRRISNIITKLGLPVQTFVSTGNGMFRKPAPGMWNALVENMNDGLDVDMNNSFYCGDAAGRVAEWAPKKKKDFSSADRLFALNIGVKFFTPEEHFLGQRQGQFLLPAFNPKAVTNLPLFEPQSASLTLSTQEMVVLVGCPGSGKSFFAKTHMLPAGYSHVNRDTLGSWQRCVSAVETALQSGKSVIVDNTNPDKESRSKFIEVAKKLGVLSRCFVLSTSKEQSKHNNKFREFTDDTHVKVNDIIINMYGTKYEEPTVEEGFKEIVKINFLPKFSSLKLEKLYSMYLIDK